jgi:hypothetical protein
MRRSALVTSLALVLLPATALAGKPSAAQANKAATAWLTALKVGDNAPDAKALAGLTAVPFVSAADHDTDASCAVTTTSTADKLGDAFDCLSGAMDPPVAKAKMKPYKKGDLGSQYDDHVKGVASIKNATVVRASTPCAGVEANIVIAVVLDGSTPKVAGVYAQSETCGE